MSDDEAQRRGGPQFGYAGDASGAGYEFWREEFCRRVMVVDLTPISDGPVRCDITPAQLPLVRMSCSTGTAMKFTSLGVNDELVLLMAPDSPLRAVMGPRALDMPSRGISLGDASIKGAYVSQLAEGGFKTALIDRKTLLENCPDAEGKVAQRLDRDPALSAFLHQYYDLAVRHAPHLDAVGQNAIAQHLIDLVVLAIGGGRDAQEVARNRGLAAARFEAVKADILSQLGNGSLTLSALAQKHRASPRYIQMLFERSGSTFSEFVLEQRLLRAARLLRDPLHRERKVSDIAHLSGFNDVSYFNRTFRRRFGMTPGDVRAGARGSGG
jgi:AraC-like DNA-binding protein